MVLVVGVCSGISNPLFGLEVKQLLGGNQWQDTDMDVR